MYWFYWFSHILLMVYTRNQRKTMSKPTFLTFRRFEPDSQNLRKVCFLYGFCWFCTEVVKSDGKQTSLTFPRSDSDFKTFPKLLLLFFGTYITARERDRGWLPHFRT